MKRNWEIIREILLKLEASTSSSANLNANHLDAYPFQDVAYNMQLLNGSERKCIEAEIREVWNDEENEKQFDFARASKLTIIGHDLLDTIRSESIWSKIKEKAKSSYVEMTIDFVLIAGEKYFEELASG